MDRASVMALLRRHTTRLLVEAQAMEDRLQQGDAEGAQRHLLRIEESLRILTRLTHSLLEKTP